MRRCALTTSVAALLLATAGASAGEFWHRAKLDWHRNNAWPEPFATADRQLAREPFCIMANNGWRLQNTVGTMLFNAETNELNRAGELKVRWIVTQAPEHRRTVFVLRGDEQEATIRRVESVQRYITTIIHEGPLPPVLLTDTDVEGVPGEYHDQIGQKYWKSLPVPRLPAMTGGGGGSTGGSGGSN